VEQLVARWAHNPKAAGSSPAPATKRKPLHMQRLFYFGQMHCVYVLFSSKFNKIYIGETANLIGRFHAHNELANKGYTKKYRPWIVVHVEFLRTRKAALAREKTLKSGKGRQWIHNNIIPMYR
jgi:putative endonuclease